METTLYLGDKPHVAFVGPGRHGLTQRPEQFCLPNLWAVHIYRYDAVVVCDGLELEIHPGYASVFPPNSKLEYRFKGVSEHYCAHFRVTESPPATKIPMMQPLAENFSRINMAFEEAISWFATQPLRSAIRLWDILWQLAAPLPHRLPTPVSETLKLIELELSNPIYVTDLARQVNLSPNHLTRLFTAATGKTVAGYIRDRRVERAAHLLRHTTMPIKAIAAEVGIPDLHLFNKSVRRQFGKPPSVLRLESRQITGRPAAPTR